MIGEQEALAVLALAARCFGVFACLPFGDPLNTLPRLCLAVVWGIALRANIAPAGELSAVSCLWEFAAGVLVGAPLRFVPDAAEMIGELIDTARGQTIASVNDPLGSQAPSDLAVVFRSAVVALAVHVGGFELMLLELRSSYELFPLGAPWLGAGHAESLAYWGISVAASALGMASVWLASFLMVDIAAAAAARLLKGVQFSLVASLVKCLLAFLFIQALGAAVQETPLEALRAWLSGWHSSASPLPASDLGEQKEPAPGGGD